MVFGTRVLKYWVLGPSGLEAVEQATCQVPFTDDPAAYVIFFFDQLAFPSQEFKTGLHNNIRVSGAEHLRTSAKPKPMLGPKSTYNYKQ